MGRIFCLMGKSSTGKDTIYRRIMETEDGYLNSLVPYTTRPIRNGETNGVEYYFVSDEEQENLEREGKIIELRAYNTVQGVWKYFTVADDQIDLENKSYFIIGTLESYVKLREYFGAGTVIPIYIEVEDGKRLQRALSREQKETQPKYEEMCRRFLADAQDFSEEKLAAAGIETRFSNEDIEDVTEKVISYINSNM